MSRSGRHVVFGSHFEVVADEPLAAEILESLGDLRTVESASRPGEWHRLCVRLASGDWTVTWDDYERYSGPEPDLALYDALIAINVHAARIAAEVGHTVLHGGAVIVGGRAVAVVGHSGAGKSTFTTAMARAGHPYLADEVVAIDDDLVVHAFHRPIGLRRGGAEAIGATIPDGPYAQIHPYRVGANDHLGTAAPLALALLLARDDATSTPRLERLTPAAALFNLANQTLGATNLERQMFRRLDALVRRVPVCQLHYADLVDARRLVEDILVGDEPIEPRLAALIA
jgi:hypothetical protein